eukprot:scaffold163253_cov31-Tisochrysis_lutea.AAC.1
MALIHSIELGFSNEPEKPPVEQLRTLEKALITRLSWQPHATLLPALLGAIGALATYLGVDGCKPLHYELCMATQAEDEVQRRSAVRGLQKLYAVLPDAVLVHSPEAVPFLSELLEDSDPEARAHALDLLNTLEQSNAGAVATMKMSTAAMGSRPTTRKRDRTTSVSIKCSRLPCTTTPLGLSVRAGIDRARSRARTPRLVTLSSLAADGD